MRQTTFHIVQRMAPGGLEMLTLRLVQSLPGEHYIISLDGTKSKLISKWPRLADLGDRLIALGKPAGIRPGRIWKLLKLMKQHRVTGIFLHHVGPLIYGGLAARLCGIHRINYVEHDLWHYESTRRRNIARVFLDFVEPTLIAITPGMVSPLAKLFPHRKIELIANGVDIGAIAIERSVARANLCIDAKAYVIGSVGRLELVKGHDILIEAFATLPGAPHLVLAGDGTRRQSLEALARDRGVAARVHFLGHRDDVPSLYPAFDLFCLPSRKESLPLAILEAQAAGVPVVATRVGDVENAIDPRTGSVCASEDIVGLARALAEAMTMKNPETPRDFVAAHFNWRHTLAGYARLAGV